MRHSAGKWIVRPPPAHRPHTRSGPRKRDLHMVHIPAARLERTSLRLLGETGLHSARLVPRLLTEPWPCPRVGALAVYATGGSRTGGMAVPADTPDAHPAKSAQTLRVSATIALDYQPNERSLRYLGRHAGGWWCFLPRVFAAGLTRPGAWMPWQCGRSVGQAAVWQQDRLPRHGGVHGSIAA